jgi:hypothetical protein
MSKGNDVAVVGAGAIYDKVRESTDGELTHSGSASALRTDLRVSFVRSNAWETAHDNDFLHSGRLKVAPGDRQVSAPVVPARRSCRFDDTNSDSMKLTTVTTRAPKKAGPNPAT